MKARYSFVFAAALLGVSVGAFADPPAAPPAPKWKIGDKVEIKWGGMWRQATIKNIRGEWYLAEWNPRSFEWAEPWRIRAVGSKEDEIGYATPRTVMKMSEPPPTEKPGAAPEPIGGARKADPKPEAQTPPASTAKPDEPPAKPADDPTFKEIQWAPNTPLPAAAWAFTPDPLPVLKTVSTPVPLKQKSSSSAALLRSDRLVLAAGAPVAVRSVNGPRMSHEELHIERIDLATGKSLGAAGFGKEVTLLDVSTDGKLVALRSDTYETRGQRLEVWSFDGTPRKILTATPFVAEDTWKDVNFAQFAGPTQLLVGHQGRQVGRIALLDVTTGKVLWQAAMSSRSNPAMSPGRKYVVVETHNSVKILEALTGKPAGELPLENFQGARWAFSPSSQQIGALARKTIRVWNLADGKMHREFTVFQDARTLEIPVDGYALLENAYLVDLDKRLILWNYRGSPVIHPAGANRVWFVSDAARSPALVTTAFPGSEVVAAAASPRLNDLLLIKPGAKVALAFNAAGEEAQRTKAQEALKKAIADAGLVLDDAAPIRIVATTETGKPYEVQYTPIGVSNRAPQKVNITPQVTRLKIEFEGKTAWETTTTVRPGIGVVQLKEGQTIEQVIAEQSKPDLLFFSRVQIPRYLQKPSDKPWLGDSELRAEK
jgi:hypothetical protein